MKDLKSLIRTYDNVLPKEICDSLIDKFEKVTCSRVYDHTEYYNFKELIIQEHIDTFKDEFNYAFAAFNERVEDYKKRLNIKFWPNSYGFEMFKLKKYPREDGYFKEHIDVTGVNTMKRFFSFFCYLNDGGGTKFTALDYKVESKPGRLILFPPQWMFPHQSINNKKTDKIILHTYLHYV